MSEWVEKPLGELAYLEIGGTPSRDNPDYWADANGDGHPWVSIADLRAGRVAETSERITDLGVRHSNVKPIKRGTVLMTFKLTIGEVALADCDLFTNEAIVAISPKSKGISSEFLFHILPGTAKSAVTDAAIKGATLNKDKLAKLVIRYPENCGQQASIARILSALDSQIEATEELMAKHEQVRAGLMQDLFTRGVDEFGQLRPPREQAPHLYHQTDLGWLPLGWAVDRITKCISTASDATIGPFGSNLVATDYRNVGVPVIFVRDVKPDHFSWKSDVFVDETKANTLTAHSSKPGDVIATKMGFPPCVACVHPEDFPDAIITADMVRLRVSRRDIAIPTYISAVLNSDVVLSQVRAITGGVTRPKITLADFRSLRVPYPPVHEQELIFGMLSVIDGLIDQQLKEVEKLCLQKSGLMHDLLTGKVPVTPLLESQTLEGAAA